MACLGALEKNRLATSRADAEDRQSRASQFRDVLHIATRRRWKIRHFSGRMGGLFPAADILVNRFAVRQLGRVAWRNLEPFPVQPITDTHTNRIDRVEAIEVG